MIYLDRLSLSVVDVAAKERMRFALNNVQIDDERSVATDGRIIAIVKHEHVEENGLKLDTPVLLHRDTVVSLRKGLPRKPRCEGDGLVEVNVADTNMNGHVALNAPLQDCSRARLRPPKGEGIFPPLDVAQKPPNEEGCVSVNVSPAILEQVCKLAKETGRNVLRIIVQKDAPNAPYYFECGTRLSGAFMGIVEE